jgi:hypothetical protein
MAAESHITVLIALNDNPSNVQYRLEKAGSATQEICKILQSIRSGLLRGSVQYHIDQADGTAASETIAWDGSDGSDGDTVGLCGVTLTAKTTASADPAEGEFALSTNDTTQAENFDACVNAHPLLRGLCTSDNSTNTSTITMTQKGVHGNLGKITVSNTDLCTLGNSGVFQSGAAGTQEKDLTIDTRARNI